MKAVILAGGSGTRGKPYTDYFPKAMTPIHGKPLIEYIVGYLAKEGITEIIIVTDLAGLGGQIKDRLEHIKKPKIVFVQDSASGTGGDLLHAADRLTQKDFVLWFADNLCAVDIGAMVAHHKRTKSLACIATRTKRREETGFATVDGGLVRRFHEKPVIELPMSECLGVYIVSRQVIELIRKKRGPVNLSYDILESLSEKGGVSAFDMGDRLWIDIDSPVTVERNGATVDRIIRQMGQTGPSQK